MKLFFRFDLEKLQNIAYVRRIEDVLKQRERETDKLDAHASISYFSIFFFQVSDVVSTQIVRIANLLVDGFSLE